MSCLRTFEEKNIHHAFSVTEISFNRKIANIYISSTTCKTWKIWAPYFRHVLKMGFNHTNWFLVNKWQVFVIVWTGYTADNELLFKWWKPEKDYFAKSSTKTLIDSMDITLTKWKVLSLYSRQADIHYFVISMFLLAFSSTGSISKHSGIYVLVRMISVSRTRKTTEIEINYSRNNMVWCQIAHECWF